MLSHISIRFGTPRELMINSSASTRSCRQPCCTRWTAVAQRKTASVPFGRTTDNSPNLWVGKFISCSRNSNEEIDGQDKQLNSLKSDVSRLIAEEKAFDKQLELIDTVKQLGLMYHFEEEIMDVLSRAYKVVEDRDMAVELDVYGQALLFRLLREFGFNISQDLFKNLIDETGSFKGAILQDVRGLLSLYEASYLAIEGDDIMEDVREFTTKHLRNLREASLDVTTREQVKHALELPLNWRLQRLHTRWFIEMYQRKENMNLVLLNLAKQNFNLVQITYKRELRALLRWWNDLNILRSKLCFSTDKLVENYLWAAGWALEPKLWRCREAMTKANCFVGIIDDMFDNYGSLEDLELFTDAVERWEVSGLEQLPEYMKICFLALFNTTNSISYEVLIEDEVYILPYLKRGWTDMCKSFLVEAKWHNGQYTPTLEEYLENAWISSTGHIALSLAYCVNDDLTIEDLKYFKTYPDIIRWSSMILRLANDLAISTENIEKDVPNCIHCYMMERDISETEAREHMLNLITAAWKKLNGHRFASSSFERTFTNVALNIPRMAQFFYQHGDGYKKPDHTMRDSFFSLLT